MTNIEVLQGRFLTPNIPGSVFKAALVTNGLAPEGDYNVADEKAMDLSLAALIYTACTAPASIKELDYQLTNQSVKDLLKLRSAILKKHGVKDEFAPEKPTIRGRQVW